MSKRLLAIIEEFQLLIKSEPPYADYFKGDIVKWLEKKLVKESIEDKRLLKTNFFNISLKYFNENKNTITENVLNARKVLDHLKKTKPEALKLKQGCDASQIITLFRILHKELKVFDNSNEEVIRALDNLIECSKGHIKDYFSRKKNKANEKKVKKLFKCEWEDLYKMK